MRLNVVHARAVHLYRLVGEYAKIVVRAIILAMFIFGCVAWLAGRILFYHIPRLLAACLTTAFYYIFARVTLYLISPRRLHHVPYLSVICVMSGGIYISMTGESWVPFQRSGSLLVILAAALYGADYKRSLKEGIDKISAEFAALLQKHDRQALRAQRLYSTDLARDMRRIRSEWDGVDIEKETRAARTHELLILMLGTIVWGFGDLVGLLF